MTIEELQKEVERVFSDAFGCTSLKGRLRDINRENTELQRWRTVGNLREEAGQLLASVIMLCNECEWDLHDVVKRALTTIEARKDQYHSMGRKIRVAIYGGAFDPVTLGHIDVGQFVLDVSEAFGNGIDEVWYTPCFKHLNNKVMSPAEVRVRMLECATRNDPRLRVFRYEIEKEFAGDTHSFVTRLLEEDFAKNQYSFSFIMGMDRANTAHTWVNWSDLEQMIPFIVVPRAGIKPDPKVTWYKQPPHMDLSRSERTIRDTASSEVRRIIEERRDENKLPELLDAKVLEIIDEVKLYRSRKPMAGRGIPKGVKRIK